MFHKYSDISLDTSAIISSVTSKKLVLGKNQKNQRDQFSLSRSALERTIQVIDLQISKAKKSRFKEAVKFTSENSILKE